MLWLKRGVHRLAGGTFPLRALAIISFLFLPSLSLVDDFSYALESLGLGVVAVHKMGRLWYRWVASVGFASLLSACGYVAANKTLTWVARGPGRLREWLDRSAFLRHEPFMSTPRRNESLHLRYEVGHAALWLSDLLVCRMPAEAFEALNQVPGTKERVILPRTASDEYRKQPASLSLLLELDKIPNGQVPTVPKVVFYQLLQTLLVDWTKLHWVVTIWLTTSAEVKKLTSFLAAAQGGTKAPNGFTSVDVTVLTSYLYWLSVAYPKLDEKNLVLVYGRRDDDPDTLEQFQEDCRTLVREFREVVNAPLEAYALDANAIIGKLSTYTENETAQSKRLGNEPGRQSGRSTKGVKKGMANGASDAQLVDVHFLCRRSGDLYLAASNEYQATKFFDPCRIRFSMLSIGSGGLSGRDFLEQDLQVTKDALEPARISP